MQIHYLASYPYELWPLIIELDDGWLVEWCPPEESTEGKGERYTKDWEYALGF